LNVSTLHAEGLLFVRIIRVREGSSKHLVEHDSKGPNIASLVIPANADFRCFIERSSDIAL